VQEDSAVKELLKFAFWFGVGYVVTTKVAPAIQARYEAIDLDSVWEIWDTEEWM
jgi:hypothetical protein